jgi:hypothetical protein
MIINKDIVSFTTSISKILDYKIWTGNRLVDNQRVSEILDSYIKDSYKCVPSAVYITKNNEIFDGAHRFLAAKELYYKHHIDLKITVYKLNSNDTQKYFIRINNSVPVPEIYKNNVLKKELCLDIVKYFIENYRDFMSTSTKPKRPNFNQDSLTDDINEIIEKYPTITKEIFLNSVKKANDFVKQNINKSEQIKKCLQKDFYLFLDASWIQLVDKNINDFLLDPFGVFS